MYNKSNMMWNCATDIYFYSHKLDKNILEDWNNKHGRKLDSPLLLHFIDEHKLKLQFFMPESIPLKNVGIRANMWTIHLMVAFNLSEPGCHIWWPPGLWPVKYDIQEYFTKIGVILPFHPFADRKYENYPVDEKMLRRFSILLGATTSMEATQFYHYLKAMNLLSSPSPEAKFYEEIFINFWKCIERFIAVEINKDRKQVNNIKPILKVYKSLGDPFDDDWLNEIKMLYKLRGNTIAHSYGKEVRVTFEEVGKCKVFADFLMYKHLMDYANKKLEQMRKEHIESPELKVSMKSKEKFNQ